MDKTAAKQGTTAQNKETKSKGDNNTSKKESQLKEQNKKIKDKKAQDRRKKEEDEEKKEREASHATSRSGGVSCRVEDVAGWRRPASLHTRGRVTAPVECSASPLP